MNIYTIGHSNQGFDKFVETLRYHHIKNLVDIRSYPSSRHCPHFNKQYFEENLPSDISYFHLLNLGGRRTKQGVERDINGYWQHPSFHNYADYMLSNDFKEGIKNLIEINDLGNTAYMCSECVHWRCHRGLVSDYMLELGYKVLHINGEKLSEHKRRESSVFSNKQLTYPSQQLSLI